jgi:hypothetical protein
MTQEGSDLQQSWSELDTTDIGDTIDIPLEIIQILPIKEIPVKKIIINPWKKLDNSVKSVFDIQEEQEIEEKNLKQKEKMLKKKEELRRQQKMKEVRTNSKRPQNLRKNQRGVPRKLESERKFTQINKRKENTWRKK